MRPEDTPGNGGPGNTAPGYPLHPGYKVELVPCPKRLRVAFGGETLAETTRALVLRETAHVPVYYFPRDHVRMDLMHPSDHTTHCPFKGNAVYWSITVGDRHSKNAVWGYPTPYDEVPELADYVAFYWDRVDQWREEDEEVFVHARDPFVRIDILKSSRPVRVDVGGETVAESKNALFLFETGLPVRYYIPQKDVQMHLLTPTETKSACPYKGVARYWSVNVGGQEIADLAWGYADPVRESAPIKDFICFYNERVDAIYMDGVAEAKPKTKWSKD
jgi:uncharacterized protein (DUF427 family)